MERVQKGLDLATLPQPRLGRLYAPDVRDNRYGVTRALRALTDLRVDDVPARPFKDWYSGGWWGDQGDTAQCVIYSGLHLLHDGPVYQGGPKPLAVPVAAYCEAQTLDEWDGDCGRNQYDGTSVRAGMKVWQQRGIIREYRWAQTPEEIILYLLTSGPVQMGTWWRRSMFYPDNRGYIPYEGAYDGGHAWVANGVHLPANLTVRQAVARRVGYIRGKNSWGRAWGRRGHFFMRMEDFVECFLDDGEACMPTEVAYGRAHN